LQFSIVLWVRIGTSLVVTVAVRPAVYAFSLMFSTPVCHTLASMIEPRADEPPVNWSDLGVMRLLPTGTVTLLLADVEGSTRLWETQPDEMGAAIARLDDTLRDLVEAHHGVRPVEQGEGDSFVLAFARASDAVACALALQRAGAAGSNPAADRDQHRGDPAARRGNYIGPTINRTARLRDLAHGGQTVLTATTQDLVIDRLPDGAWMIDLGTSPLRDLPRPERVVQLCHPDLLSEFPPLRTGTAEVSQHLPVQLTSFVGRDEQMVDVRNLLGCNRLVTLTGAGGVGKTRMALQVAAALAREYDDGARYVDLAPITDPDVVPVAMARALGLPDQPGRSTMDTIVRSIGQRQMLVVLDNCEHLLDATAELILTLTGSCSRLTLLTTSREPIGVAGEVTWRAPSLSLVDEAVELFTDRARLARPDFVVADDNAAVVTEICRRLDGMPLAIELAAARVRALSLDEINDSLHDRFRLLTGGSRTAVRRQQTLRASVDWSHALLSEPERVLFRRLAAFAGGFDLGAAQNVAGSSEVERYQVLDQLSLLVDKSLVVAESTTGRTRYRLLETVRQYASEKLGSQARVRKSARVIVGTTHPWRPSSTIRRQRVTRNCCSKPRPKSTICERHSRGVVRTATSRRRCNWRRRCSPCGKRGAAFWRDGRGSMPSLRAGGPMTVTPRPQSGLGRSPTSPWSTRGESRRTEWTMLNRRRKSRDRSATTSCHGSAAAGASAQRTACSLTSNQPWCCIASC
jgi:predicted ATPase/class 3 adenylate cyclase